MNTFYRVWIVLFFSSILTMLLGQATAGRFGLLWGFIFSASLNCYLYFYSDKKIIKKLKAQPLEGQDPWGLNQTIKRISQKARLPIPELYIINSQTPSSFAFGRGEHHGKIAITKKLVEQFDHKQLEAIVAFHLAQIKRSDTLGISIGCTISSIFNSINRWLVPSNSTQSIFLYPSFLFTKWNSLVFLGKESFTQSDLLAKEWVSDIHALATCLSHLEAYFATQPFDIDPSLLMGLPVNPLTKTQVSDYLHTHPPLAKRIKAIIGYFPI